MTLPRDEKPFLVLRTTSRVLRDPVGYYGEAVGRLGPIYRTRAMNGELVVVANQALAREVFALPPEATGPFAVDAIRGLLGMGSVFCMGGARHARERRMLTPAFHGPRMEAFGEAIRDVVQRVVDGWVDGQEVVAAEALVPITFEIIVRVVFGVDDPARIASFLDLTQEMVAAASPALLFFPATQVRFLGLTPFDRLLATRKKVDAALQFEIDERRRTGVRGHDVLSLLIDATWEDGERVPDAHVRDELVTLLFAGHETTSIAVAWTLYELARRPDVVDRLRAELATTDGSLQALARLPLLDAVWQETLRLHPPLSDVLREVLQPVTIGGHRVEAGENLVVASCWMAMDPAVFPEPTSWNPDRWLEAKPPPFQVLPFGGGNRRCLGAALANFEAQIAIATVVAAMDLTSLREEDAVRRNATMGPKHGVRLRVQRRAEA